MLGIKELKEAVIFAVALANIVDDELRDGFQVSDLFACVPALTKAPAAISGAGEIPAELKDMDFNERAELAEEIKKLDLNSDFSEAIGEQSAVVLVEIGKLVTLVKMAKEPK